MIILSATHLSKSFGINTILDNLTFHIQKGERVGLVGINGAGKSTLFKILTGQLPYDSGELYISKSLVIGYLEQSGHLQEENTVLEEALSVFSQLIEMENDLRTLENQIASLSNSQYTNSNLDNLMNEYALLLEHFNEENGYGFRSQVKGVLRGLGFLEEEFQQPVYQLSGGQKTRLSLAKLLLSNPDILLLDEPTNHLDIQAVEWLEGFLRDYSGTILMISHDRYFLDQLVNRIFEIENHHLTCYDGNYSNYVEKKKFLKDQQLKNYREYKKEIERQKEIIRRLRQHGTEKLINRAKSREKQLSKIEIVQAPQASPSKAKIHFETVIRSGHHVLSVKNLSKSFDNTPLFENISFDIYRGEKVALIGPNGIGKSTLFKMILNEIHPTAGSIYLGHHVLSGYYDQEQKNLHPEKTIIDEIWDEHPSLNQTELRTLLGSFLFQGDDVFKKVHSLSGGEKSRLSLLKLILSRSNFLLLDEPTNHLDIDSKQILEDSLIDYSGTIFFISHDRYFINRIATKIIELDRNGVEIFLGNYSYYNERKNQQSLEEFSDDHLERTKTQIKEERRREKEARAHFKKINQHREKIEQQIIDREDQLQQLEESMCQEEIYANPQKSQEVHQEILRIKGELEDLYQEWESFVDIFPKNR